MKNLKQLLQMMLGIWEIKFYTISVPVIRTINPAKK